jgi:hypothetical protein
MLSAVIARGPSPILLLVAWALLSCGDPPAPVAPRSEPVPPARTGDDELSRFGVVELASVPGALTLYDPARWQATRAGSFAALTHAPSRSTITLRVWRAPRLVRPAECEAEARLARPSLPRIEPESIIDERPLEAPTDFDGALVVGVEPSPNGSTRGFVLAVGAAVGRCYVFAFETQADGAEAAAVVGDRLRTAADQIAPSVALYDVERRARPETDLK